MISLYSYLFVGYYFNAFFDYQGEAYGLASFASDPERRQQELLEDIVNKEIGSEVETRYLAKDSPGISLCFVSFSQNYLSVLLYQSTSVHQE